MCMSCVSCVDVQHIPKVISYALSIILVNKIDGINTNEIPMIDAAWFVKFESFGKLEILENLKPLEFLKTVKILKTAEYLKARNTLENLEKK